MPRKRSATATKSVSIVMSGARCAAGRNPSGDTAKRSCSRVTASLAPSGGITTGGSLIEGPGNASVRSAVTLCVVAARGASSAFAGSQPT